MASFLYLSRKLELVVARAAGVSAWQFITPALLVAALLGILAVMAYNPFAVMLKETALHLEAQALGKESRDGAQGFWIRQRTSQGQSILNAKQSLDMGQRLMGVSVYRYDNDGKYLSRIEASEAVLGAGYWQLSEARLYEVGVVPITVPLMSLRPI